MVKENFMLGINECYDTFYDALIDGFAWCLGWFLESELYTISINAEQCNLFQFLVIQKR